ncbi:Protein tyrosine phosphatase type IVA 3 [Sarcoptes scabiei]|nr:Protein tyrosine phosphatase type IVA 3 [Sarcoptes scabiei]
MTANTNVGNIANQSSQQQQHHHHHHHHHNNLILSGGSGRCGPSLIKYRNLRFLITDKPTDATLNQYVERRNVTDVVRVCESTYSSQRLENAGIKCHDWAFDDGTPPPSKIIEHWLSLIIDRFKDLPQCSKSDSNRKASTFHNTAPSSSNSANDDDDGSSSNNVNQIPCIAVHCVAGLGRAPVLVAIALIEAGLKYEDAVEMIRAARRGAINAKQLDYLSEYKPKKVLIFNKGSSSKRKFCCII